MLNTTVKLNDFASARVISDTTAEDPRLTNLKGDAAEGIFILNLEDRRANADLIVPSWFKSFQEIDIRLGSERATRAMSILRSLGADIPAYISKRLYQGYSQGDWADLVISGPSAEIAQGAYERFAAWTRGDVYGIIVERKCPVTGDWFTVEDELPLFGIYCTKDLEFYGEVRAVAAEHFDLDARPVSEAGKLTEERQLSKNTVVELGVLLTLLEDQAGGSSELSRTAREIIAEQDKIIASLEEEVAELR